MNMGAENALDAFQRPLQIAAHAPDQLRMLRRLAGHERPLPDRVEHALRARPWQLLVPQHEKRRGHLVARYADAPLALTGGIDLLGRVDPSAIERDDDAVGLGIVQARRYRHRAP